MDMMERGSPFVCSNGGNQHCLRGAMRISGFKNHPKIADFLPFSLTRGQNLPCICATTALKMTLSATAPIYKNVVTSPLTNVIIKTPSQYFYHGMLKCNTKSYQFR